MMKILNQLDFKCVGLVAQHCNTSKLCIAESEAILFDLNGLFCDFWITIENIIKEIEIYELNPSDAHPENYELKKNLINGGSFTSCNEQASNHVGIKQILTYYTYARYILINSFDDTPSGHKTKTDDFTIPKTIKELELFADKYRSMGFESFKRTSNFLCHNKDVFQGFNHKECAKCSCECNSCSGTTKAKGYGFKSSIIRR